jgi:hypothetical protein
VDPLAQLNDIHLPQAIGFWPLAYGWWILLVVTILLLVSATIGGYLHWKKQHPKRQALQLLEQLTPNQADWPQQINSLLKRLALSYFPAEQVASLQGKAWLGFLSTDLSETKKQQVEQTLESLHSVIYSNQPHSLELATTKPSIRLVITKLPLKTRKNANV